MLGGAIGGHAHRRARAKVFLGYRTGVMRNPGFGLRIKTLPGTSVNKDEVWFLTNLAHSPGYLLASIENFEDNPA